MRIVQVSVGSMRVPPEQGGAPLQVIFNTSKHLARMGHDVTILDSRYSKEDAAIDCFNGLKIRRLKSIKLPVPRSSKTPRYVHFALNELNAILFAVAVSRYLKRRGRDIDVIHLHLTSVGVILSILNSEFRGKMIYTSHLGQWVLRGTRKLTMLERIHILFDSYLMKRVAKVIALNDSARDTFISIGKINAENVVVVHNGVDVDFFHPASDTERARIKYGLGDRLIILFVGQLTRIKGVEQLAKAAKIIIKEFGYKDISFVFAGPLTFGTLERPIDMKNMMNYIRQNRLENNIIFTGALSLEEIRELYATADIFVMPSLAETGPLVTLEAMATGKPVIGTTLGAMPEQIRDGWNGFLVDPGDEWQLAGKIKYLLDNPEERKRMGANSRRYVEEEFDWRKVTEKLSSIYESN